MGGQPRRDAVSRDADGLVHEVHGAASCQHGPHLEAHRVERRVFQEVFNVKRTFCTRVDTIVAPYLDDGSIWVVHRESHIVNGFSQPDLVPIPHTSMRRLHGYPRLVCGILILNILGTFALTRVCGK